MLQGAAVEGWQSRSETRPASLGSVTGSNLKARGKCNAAGTATESLGAAQQAEGLGEPSKHS